MSKHISKTNESAPAFEWQIQGAGRNHEDPYEDAELAAEDFKDLVARGRTGIALVRRQVGAWETVEES